MTFCYNVVLVYLLQLCSAVTMLCHFSDQHCVPPLQYNVALTVGTVFLCDDAESVFLSALCSSVMTLGRCSCQHCVPL